MAHPTWRRVQRYFSISAPRMAVRRHFSWPWRVGVGGALVALVAGMWWWGYDFGQFFGGFNRKEIEAELATVRADAAKFAQEASLLRQAHSTLESELAMARGTQGSLSKQVAEITQENAQLKEELAFLQKLVADSSRQVGVSIPRVSLERGGRDTWIYRVLVVRGGAPKDEFDGHLSMTATLGSSPAGGPATIALPADQPEATASLKLRFKYYQRVEGTLRVPPGAEVRSLTVRAHENGASAPRVSRTLALS
jgi:hypothetical protein